MPGSTVLSFFYFLGFWGMLPVCILSVLQRDQLEKCKNSKKMSIGFQWSQSLLAQCSTWTPLHLYRGLDEVFCNYNTIRVTRRSWKHHLYIYKSYIDFRICNFNIEKVCSVCRLYIVHCKPFALNIAIIFSISDGFRFAKDWMNSRSRCREVYAQC